MGDSVFWGVIVEPGQPSAYVPPPEENARLHVSQAVLDPAAEDGARVWLQCKVQDGAPLAVAALRCGGTEAQPLDLILDQYTEFTVQGPAAVHVTGYYIPLEEYDEDEDEEHDHDHEADHALAQQYGLPTGMTLDQMRKMYADGDFDDDDEESDEDDDEESDDAAPVFFGDAAGGAEFGTDDSDEDDEDEDEDDETSDYDSENEAAGRTRSEVLIEEIDPKQPEEVANAAGQKRKADAAAMAPTLAKRPAVQDGKQSKSAAADNVTTKPTNGQAMPQNHGAAEAVAMDEDEEDEDDDEDEDEEEDGEEDDEDEDEDEEEEAELPQQQQPKQQQGQSEQREKQLAADQQDGVQPKTQQQKQQQKQKQQQQKQPSIAEAVADAATAAKAAGQQQTSQKKGKSGKQPAANGLATPAAATPGATLKTLTTASTGRKSVRRFENGFAIEDTGMGQPDGKLAKGGKRVQMKYVGRLASNGKVFDQTKGNKPFTFRLGVGEVIKGWDRGIEGMRVGDRRKLTIPPSMAYGTKGAPPDIPPNAKLVFDVELVNVL